jgi:peptidoglycan/xylan/chitin deacetylase (PgdA/CDA1 family)
MPHSENNPVNQPDRRQIFRGAALTVGGVAAALISTPTQALATALSHSAHPDIVHGSRSKPNIALTFHGQGDPAIVQKLLAIFKSTSTPISVFAIGTWLRGYPTVAKQMLDAGYDLGNHTMNHYQMKTLGAAQVDSEIAQCAAELKKLTGNHGKWFRPSGTQRSTALIRNTAAKYGYKQCISYDVDSHDYQDVGKKAVLADVAKDIKNGSIMSLHFGHQDTIDAMPTLLENIHAKGFTPVTLTTLLGA